MANALPFHELHSLLLNRNLVQALYCDVAHSSLDRLISCLPCRGQPAKGLYVPSSHEDRYFSCSGVRVSISRPMAASFKRAISASISSGTG